MNPNDTPQLGYDYLAGTTLLVDKPLDWTSFQVVSKLRYKIKTRLGLKKIKVGHSGTLDPKATGLLIICTGKSTKKLNGFQGLGKEYTGTIRLGATTPSFDVETEVDHHYSTDHLTSGLLEEARLQFIGAIEQVPPMYSAIKVDGQPLYKRARKGEFIEIQPRTIHIHTFEFTRIELPEIDFLVRCSKGTYIRTLAYDFGKAVHSGAYLSALRRTKVGDFDIKNAWELMALVDYIEKGPVSGLSASR